MELDRFLRVSEVIEATTLSRAEIYRRMQKGEFPRQHRISHKRAVWRQSEIIAWQERVTHA